ncbi:MAG: DUF721 domain-containing protein [Thermosynechococcaceae cyanobacterium]
MAFEGLDLVLVQLKKTHWQEQQGFEQMIRLWPTWVGPDVAAQTRPIRLTAQGILQVATSSGAWAQNLAFERLRILGKVNAVWTQPVKDIYFSTRYWHQSAPSALAGSDPLRSITPTRQLDPRFRGGGQARRSPPKDAQDAFARWSAAVRRQAHGRTLCPICQCPTPQEELQRWDRCALCTCRPDPERN